MELQNDERWVWRYWGPMRAAARVGVSAAPGRGHARLGGEPPRVHLLLRRYTNYDEVPDENENRYQVTYVRWIANII